MDLKIEWVKDALGLCLNISDMEEAEKRERFAELEKAYSHCSKEDKESIHEIIASQLECMDRVYVYSVFVKYFRTEDFGEKALDYIMQLDINWYLGNMLELQAVANVKNCYEKKRKLHKQNVDRYDALWSADLSYIPMEKRNKKRIVIVTEQLLSALHSPTQIVLNFAYALQNVLGFEVLLFACPCDGDLPESVWNEPIVMNSIEQFKAEPMRIKYQESFFRGYQISMSAMSLKEYEMALLLIHEWNPIFVFAMGVINPVVDSLRNFTSLAVMTMSIDCPISEGQILIRLGSKNDEAELEYQRIITEKKQTQLFMKERIPVLTDKSSVVYSRKELGLPEDKFLITVVGNRLDKEIDAEFAGVIKRILAEHIEAAVVVIGEVKETKSFFAGQFLENHIFYLGYRSDLAQVYTAMDLYLNPRRSGGGFSSSIALMEGVPVVTLPNCDVAYNTGKQFVVNNYEEMEVLVHRYITEEPFYQKMKELARIEAERNTDDKMVQYVKKMTDEIIRICEGE